METKIKDKIEYTVICISEFAKKHQLTLPQAFNYLKTLGGHRFS